MRLMKPAAITIAVLMLAACAKPMPMAHSPDFAPVQPLPRDTNAPATGAIFAADNTDLWQAKRRNYRVGDIITVLLSESTQAARTLNNETSRESSTDAIPQGMTDAITRPTPILNGLNTGGAKTSNKGTGVADQRASLTGSIAVTVTEVQANGNLVIRGEKQLSLSEGGEVIQVAGIIRPDDVSAINTVQSRRLANGQITYKGVGDLANATRAGWGISALYKYWPF
ncbi:FlgH Flagellar basal body L-ring protein [Oxalobacteraceae bacterium]|jgi:flagellar L-ring protein precursor FlgH